MTATPSVEDAEETGPGRESLASSARRGALWAVAANITMRFASIGITAVLARLLSKDDFGVFAVSLSIYLIVASLAELGMASAVVRSTHEPEDIAPTIATISILVSAGIGVAMATTAPLLATLLGQPAAAQPIRVLSICLVLTGIFAVPGAQLVREFRQDRIFLATVVGFVVANPLLIVLALHGGGATAFAWSRVVGQLATGVVFVLSTSRHYWPRWRREVVGPLMRFGLPLSIANLVNWSLLNADYVILGRLVDAAEIGVYLIAFNVANWATAVLGSVLNSVVVPVMGRVVDDRERLTAAIVSATELVALVALPMAAISAGVAGPLVATVFGARWSDAAPVLVVLAGYGALYSFSLLFVNILVAAGRTVRLLLIQLAWVAVLVPAIVGGVHLWGLQGVAWAHVLTIGVVATPAYALAVSKVTGARPTTWLRVVGRPALAAVLAGVVAHLVSSVIALPWVSLGVGGLVGCLVYAAVVLPVAVRRLPARLVPDRLARLVRQDRTGTATP